MVLFAIGFEKYGSEEELERDAIKHLYDVYVKINNDAATDESVLDKAREYFKRMEGGKPIHKVLPRCFSVFAC